MTASLLKPSDTSEVPVLHTSVFLRQLIENAPENTFTLSWLLRRMPNSSYGFLILFFALVSVIPVVGVPASLLIMIFAAQIVLGFRSPSLPKILTRRSIATKHLARIPTFIFSFLHFLERMSSPRWTFMLKTRRLSGLIVFGVATVGLLAPLPFASLPAALVIIFMAFAYIEHDGMLLFLAQLLGTILLAITFCLVFIAFY